MFQKVKAGPARRLVVQYVERKRLATLGFNQPLDSVDADTVEGLLIVDSYLDELRDIDREADERRARRK